ncbi:MAG: bifunctional phosphoribosylaminoimidazolecarboxamide formyltransferase/IMP cyclohydrolase [Acidobacteria bacterium]|nr:bifunctional phosphoribosylaminoimidazolecarboxamide formyltransferase/IMP cyclohydrolase [Acidobacteriota bacterium]MDA1233400.1 bifunctional phosphoribosylaminoimidazolecarboxamide formyltransferase/IMP cyclohydrolase [Acidobacteriota bacterium]
MSMIRRALLSVTDKSGLAPFAERLAARGIELISTGGTASLLRDNGLAVRDVSEVTGFPEMLDGRVKTIHPRVAAGMLAIRSNPEHMAALDQHEIAPIDMVVVNLYAFEKTASKPGVSFEEIIENIDIGGPTMIRAAAKNYRDVAVVTSPADYAALADELESNEGCLSEATHWRLAQQAFAMTAAYDRAISTTLAGISASGERAAADEALPATLDILSPRKSVLRYGENPHQQAALYGAGDVGVASAKQLHGKELSYNNLVDLDAAWALIEEFADPAVAIIKHTNPCGCAEQSSLAEAYRLALACDPVSAFGSVISVNRSIDRETAEAMSELFVEAIAASAYDADALEVLRRKKNLRLLQVKPASAGLVIKSISGGFLAQTEDRTATSGESWNVVSKRAPSPEEEVALRFGWKVVKHVKSNAILYAKPGQTVGVGAGQMSRVDSARIGAQRAHLPVAESVVASDAFFPFADGVEELAKAGATAVVQPGGSMRDQEVIDAADKLGLAMVMTGVRHFRH